MTKTLLLAALTLGVAVPSLSGCSFYQAYAQRRAIEQAQFHLKSLTLNGFDLAGANIAVTLELENPTDTTLALDRLDYVLFINELRAFSGNTGQTLHVPAHDVRPLTLNTYIRYRDVSNQLRDVLLRGLSGLNYRVEGVGHFDTPIGVIDYPVRIGPSTVTR